MTVSLARGAMTESNARDRLLAAFREACDLAAEKTGLPLFYGNPEAG